MHPIEFDALKRLNPGIHPIVLADQVARAEAGQLRQMLVGGKSIHDPEFTQIRQTMAYLVKTLVETYGVYPDSIRAFVDGECMSYTGL